MPGGRPPKPKHLKVLHGDAKKNPQRVNRAEPVPGEGAIEVPEWLTPEALEVWGELAPDRIRVGVLTSWDVEAFAHFCESVVIARRKALGAYRDPEPGSASGVSEYRAMVSILATLGGRFGWTPSDRQKIVMEDRGGPKEDLLSSG